jgi:hypothetical protein
VRLAGRISSHEKREHMETRMSCKFEISWKMALLVLVTVACGGCGPKDDLLSKRGSVKGTVTLNGEPLETGRITFTATGKEANVTGADIIDGAYEVPREKGPIAGKVQVSISSPRKTGKQIPAVMPAKEGTMIDIVEESIPDKYNTRTTLTVEIEAGDNPDVDFELTKN